MAINNKQDLGKFLSWILRHGAVKEGIPIELDGFVSVENLLDHKFIKGRFSKDDILKVVETDEKSRFAVRFNQGSFDIRANQGHSIKIIDQLQLTPITDAKNFKCVVHGTFLVNWTNIKTQGLHRMTRNHIHFAQNLPNCNKVISGVRKNAEVYIYINLEKALGSGLKFFLSANGVILSPGNDQGYIKPIFFLKVCKRDGALLSY